jgi:SIR2-like domain
MAAVIGERIWQEIIGAIEADECTAFIGAGASAARFQVGARLAGVLAQQYGYPLEDYEDLARVAQFVSIHRVSTPQLKRDVARLFRGDPPDFRDQDDPHGMLADLPLSVYVTTNYDDLMCQALLSRSRQPIRAVCPWYTQDRTKLLEARKPFKQPERVRPHAPIVYHLHGHHDVPESLVLTEDDYIEFLVQASKNNNLLPPPIREALSSRLLLFIGYSLHDWTFRVLFRGLLTVQPSYAQYSHVSVQLPPGSKGGTKPERHHVKEYLDEYFSKQNISVFWGSANDFTEQLRDRWNARPREGSK